MSRPYVVFATLLLCSLLLVSTGPAHAQSTPSSADFDAIAEGVYTDPLISGTPDYMSISAVANALTLYPNLVPPGASGNILRIDNSTQTTDAVLRFDYDCGPGDATTDCRINYAFVAWSMVEGKGMQVHIDDDGTLASPDYSWAGVIPEGDWQVSLLGAESHDAVGCSAAHTLDVVVEGGALVMLDGITSECLTVVPTERPSFGAIKSRFD